MQSIAPYIDNVPVVSGFEQQIKEAISLSKNSKLFSDNNAIDFKNIKSASAIALHMHQPLIPAGGDDLRSAELISNLEHMMRNPHVGDNHNASVFHWCYKRIGTFVPQLLQEGKQPRVMLEYSGTLLHGLYKMGLHDVIDDLRNITCDPNLRRCVEWLGCPWGHPVAPSTPVQDYKLHVLAFQQFFAGLFGLEAVSRLRGFSPSEMALPNHPDVAYEFVKTLRECGYTWVLVQEHTIERPENGYGPEYPHIPHRLVCTNSKGETQSIIAVIKTQGSDTKLVAQMQPYFEAKTQNRRTLTTHDLKTQSIPSLVTQIADGENGGVMMNEFPQKYLDTVREASHTQTPLMNVTEYLEYLSSMGIAEEDFPVVQPIHQKLIWENFNPSDGAKKLEQVIDKLKKENHRFHMDGGSWTNNISWVSGYDNVLGPIERASSLFNEKVLKAGVSPSDFRFRNALFHLMCSQTSCYRYWGQGQWTDYGIEICRRANAILESDF